MINGEISNENIVYNYYAAPIPRFFDRLCVLNYWQLGDIV